MSSREFNCPLCVSPRLSPPRGYFPPPINKSKESQWKTLQWATQCQLATTTMEDQSKLAPPTGCCLSGHQWVCTVAQGEKLSKCREEDVYSTLLNSTLLSTGRVERCLMDDPDFSGSSPKAGIRWRAAQCKTNCRGGWPGKPRRIGQLFLHLLHRGTIIVIYIAIIKS